MPKLKEQVGKVGVWKRLDLASLKRTKAMKAKRQWEEAKVEGRDAGEGAGRRGGGMEWEGGMEG